MSDNLNAHLNLYDFFGFPDRTQRDGIRQTVDLSNIRLIPIDDPNLRFFNSFLEQYSSWSYHINNFSSGLGLHFFLLYFHYSQGAIDTIKVEDFQPSRGIHKVYFDTFAEDTALYLISYFDKHLEMFNDLYNLQRQSGKSRNLSRKQVITEMKKVQSLELIAEEYQKVMEQKEFVKIKAIRDNFVHNKSSSYYGMNVDKKETAFGMEYRSFNSKGVSTEEIYNAICILINSYGQMCIKVNSFIKNIVKK